MVLRMHKLVHHVSPAAGDSHLSRLGHLSQSSRCKLLYMSKSSDTGGENEKNTSLQEQKSIDKNLVRPPINIRKESILFGDDPATAGNNNISRLWQTLKQNLPYVFTGVPKNEVSAVDDNPIGAIYNMIFVRFPSVLASIVYTKNLIEGHPLYCDIGFGAGPFEIPPLFVYGVLLIILR